MRSRMHAQLLVLPAALLLLGAARPLAAQRAGELNWAIDMKSGRFGSAFSTEPARAPDTLAVPAARAFAALPAAFRTLGVPLTTIDSAEMAMGAVRVAIRRPLAGQRLSSLVECGTGAYGPNAERYAVQLSVVAIVRALDSTRTLLQTRVEGQASPNGLNSSVRCSSSGRLEELMHGTVRKELGL